MFSTRILRTSQDKHDVFSGQYQEMEDTLVYFDRTMTGNRTYIAALVGQKVVGIVSLKEGSSRVPGAWTITFVAVSEAYRNQGVAKLLVEALFRFANLEGKALANTQYEEEGLLYLKPALHAAAARFPAVALHEYPVH